MNTRNQGTTGFRKRKLCFAERLVAGRVVINGAPHDPRAPFGGFRQSGPGREIGAYGLDAFLEPRAILTPAE
jgi:aldehyde dehydrogenase (NAD+)